MLHGFDYKIETFVGNQPPGSQKKVILAGFDFHSMNINRRIDDVSVSVVRFLNPISNVTGIGNINVGPVGRGTIPIANVVQHTTQHRILDAQTSFLLREVFMVHVPCIANRSMQVGDVQLL